MKKLFTQIGICLVLVLSASAQKSGFKLTDLSLNDLSNFKNPASNWQIKGDVSGSFADVKLQSKPGTSVLLNNLPAKFTPKREMDLFTNLQHADIHLELDFMMPKGSNSGIYLQSRYEVQLFDSWGKTKLQVADCGSIYERWDDARPEGKRGFEGHLPRQNASMAPGLWQHLAITFEAPKFDGNGKKIKNAKFVKIMLNNVVIHENVPVTGPTRAGLDGEAAFAPIMIQGDHGGVAFRNIKYALLNDFDLTLKDLNYEFYDLSKGFEKRSEKPDKIGKADAIDYRYGDNPEKLLLNFKAKFDIKEEDEYTFSMARNGQGGIKIDGQEIFKPNWKLIPDVSSGKVRLSPGEHNIEVNYSKDFTWRASALGVFVQRTNTRPFALHEAASMPDIPADPEIKLTPTTEPVVQRSYWAIDGKRKLTHALSVGTPAGVHFLYNLNQASLQGVWKGAFLRTTDMWYERGEPQEAQASGSAVSVLAKCPIAGKTLTDTLEDRNELIYKGYHFGADRTPIFDYVLNGKKFTDKISANNSGNGLIREINIEESAEGLQFRLADGDSIEEITKGTFVVDKKYYLTLNKDLKPSILQAAGKKTLVVATTGKKPISSISYELLW